MTQKNDRKRMVIGLDMDGVLRELDLAMIHTCEILKNFDPFYVNSLTATKPLLNPMDIALP
jgi:3-deoxy-D-manno-octulosonate 8-phosphate phosphatase KdsC-like HAD superfamily phosphatase